MFIRYCCNDPCEAEAVTKRKDSSYCFTCAEAYDAGYEAGYEAGYADMKAVMDEEMRS